MRLELQLVVKELDGFGEPLFTACLQDSIPYVDRIVLTDNGCSDKIKDVYRTLIPQDKLTLIELEGRLPFDELRNAGMSKTNSDCDWMCFIDSDELFGKQVFDEARQAEQEGANTCQIGLHHLCAAPCFVDSSIKHFHPRFFRKVEGARFSGKLHEGPTHHGPTKMLPTKQVHLGYCRPQWQVFLKWCWYNFLQDGHLGGLKLFLQENPNKNPNNFMQTSKSLVEYKGPWRALTPLVQKFGLTRDNWFAYLEAVEDYSTWHHWQELFQDKGNWWDTLDPMLKLVYGLTPTK